MSSASAATTRARAEEARTPQVEDVSSEAFDLEDAIQAAAGRIAPTWPLDQFIAVNPYWGSVHQPIAEAAARLGRLSGATLLMPPAWYREHWEYGRLRRRHLLRAIEAAGSSCTVDELRRHLDSEETPRRPRLLLSDHVDGQRDLRHAAAWRDVVIQHISQHCAAWFDRDQASCPPSWDEGLYASWRHQSSTDHGPRLLMGYRGFGARVAQLPADPRDLIAQAVETLGVPEHAAEDYFSALLLDVNGWAAWCAQDRWQAGLAGRADQDLLTQLLAIRLAWEWLLWDTEHRPAIEEEWSAQWSAPITAELSGPVDDKGWLLQRAMEFAYQEGVVAGLTAAPRKDTAADTAPAVQAVFCIDVRSEVFRRALESVDPRIQTRGFAGFFGLPIAYQPLGTELTRPQLPGLLSPRFTITDSGDSAEADATVARDRRRKLSWGERWQQFRSMASSGFSFVETCGLLYAGKLLRGSLPSDEPRPPVERSGLSEEASKSLRPRLGPITTAEDADASETPGSDERCELARGILGAMGLAKGDFARLVLLAGHGSHTTNNPHASGYDCGACGGQTGEVNSRALVQLLNDPEVRKGLAADGLVIPETTRFVAGLHNTTTDDVELFDLEHLPPGHAGELAQLQSWLARAGTVARAERAESLGLQDKCEDPTELATAIRRRSGDWSEVRPEWGLADNAAFIVAPRSRSRHLNLEGRSFLHDYRWQDDEGFGVLELIMTAPMVVTNWINLQYYASTVDPRRYGSGNKVLHNVVGGRIGVFEGNAGDLRIGLPWQSLHDGEQLRHTPLRLSVFIEAPAEAIDEVLAKHEVVRHLVENEWLHLLRIEPTDGSIHQRRAGGWVAMPSAKAHAE